MKSPSPGADLTLAQVAEELGLHYMTVYKYVRTGRLPAQRIAGQWRVSPADLAGLLGTGGSDGATGPLGADRAPTKGAGRAWSAELARTLIAGTEAASWDLCQQALASSHTPESLYLDMLAPAMRSIGSGWESGTVSVAQEHRASALAGRLIGRLGPMFIRPGRSRGGVVLAAPSGDTHALATALLSDPLRGRGLTVTDLGADAPVSSMLDALHQLAEADQSRPPRELSVGIALTSPIPDETLCGLVDALRRETPARIVIGGIQALSLSAGTCAAVQDRAVTITHDYAGALDVLAG
jgi:excisionase family DNA binding protein